MVQLVPQDVLMLCVQWIDSSISILKPYFEANLVQEIVVIYSTFKYKKSLCKDLHIYKENLEGKI